MIKYSKNILEHFEYEFKKSLVYFKDYNINHYDLIIKSIYNLSLKILDILYFDNIISIEFYNTTSIANMFKSNEISFVLIIQLNNDINTILNIQISINHNNIFNNIISHKYDIENIIISNSLITNNNNNITNDRFEFKDIDDENILKLKIYYNKINTIYNKSLVRNKKLKILKKELFYTINDVIDYFNQEKVEELANNYIKKEYNNSTNDIINHDKKLYILACNEILNIIKNKK